MKNFALYYAQKKREYEENKRKDESEENKAAPPDGQAVGRAEQDIKRNTAGRVEKVAAMPIGLERMEAALSLSISDRARLILSLPVDKISLGLFEMPAPGWSDTLPEGTYLQTWRYELTCEERLYIERRIEFPLCPRFDHEGGEHRRKWRNALTKALLEDREK